VVAAGRFGMFEGWRRSTVIDGAGRVGGGVVDWPAAALRRLSLDGLVVLLRAFQHALQEPGGSVLGLAGTGTGGHQGLPGFRTDGGAGDPRLLAAVPAWSSSLLVPGWTPGYRAKGRGSYRPPCLLLSRSLHSWRRNGASFRSAAGSCVSSSAGAVASVSAAARDWAAKSPLSPLCRMHHCVHSGSRRSAALA